MNVNELRGKKAVISPFNPEAIIIYHKLIKEGVDIVGFLDKERNLHNMNYNGVPVFPYMRFDGIIVIVAKVSKTAIFNEIYRQLMESQYKNDEVIRHEDIEFNIEAPLNIDDINYGSLKNVFNCLKIHLLKEKLYEYSGKGFSVHALNLVTTTRCSLKCEGCCTLMDYYRPNEQRDMDIGKIIDSFNKIMEHVDYFYDIVPIGGEPFLAKGIDELLLHLVSGDFYKQYGKIKLITNCTVLPQKSTLEILGEHNDKIITFLTDYGKLSRKRFELTRLLNEYGCFYRNHVHDSWFLTNIPITPNQNTTLQDVKAKCDICDCRKGGRLRVLENRIHTCHFVPFATECKAIPDDERNYIDLEKQEISKEILKEFLQKTLPGMFYCSAPSVQDEKVNIPIPVGKQVKSTVECIRYE